MTTHSRTAFGVHNHKKRSRTTTESGWDWIKSDARWLNNQPCERWRQKYRRGMETNISVPHPSILCSDQPLAVLNFFIAATCSSYSLTTIIRRVYLKLDDRGIFTWCFWEFFTSLLQQGRKYDDDQLVDNQQRSFLEKFPDIRRSSQRNPWNCRWYTLLTYIWVFRK